jgi:hypothetical protein
MENPSIQAFFGLAILPIASGVLLGLLSVGPRWLWATTICLCLMIVLVA